MIVQFCLILLVIGNNVIGNLKDALLVGEKKLCPFFFTLFYFFEMYQCSLMFAPMGDTQ